MQSEPVLLLAHRDRSKETQACIHACYSHSLAKKSLCVKGCTALFKAKMEESFHIFGGLNYVWYMLLYCFTISFD